MRKLALVYDKSRRDVLPGVYFGRVTRGLLQHRHKRTGGIERTLHGGYTGHQRRGRYRSYERTKAARGLRDTVTQYALYKVFLYLINSAGHFSHKLKRVLLISEFLFGGHSLVICGNKLSVEPCVRRSVACNFIYARNIRNILGQHLHQLRSCSGHCSVECLVPVRMLFKLRCHFLHMEVSVCSDTAYLANLCIRLCCQLIQTLAHVLLRLFYRHIMHIAHR